MPLQTPTTLTAALITSLATDARSHLAAAAGKYNAITQALLALDNEQLADFGNFLGPQEMAALTTSHADQGEALNALIAGINAILGASGVAAIIASVDVRPLGEKLAGQGRGIVLTGEVFSVVALPAPEPEPEAPPQEG